VTEVQPSPKPRSRRIYWLWGTALALLFALGAFCWLVVVPVWEVNRAADRCESGIIILLGTATGPSEFAADTLLVTDPAVLDRETGRLGGPKPAARRLSAYLGLPRWLTPHRFAAIVMLGRCRSQSSAAVSILEEHTYSVDKHERLAARNALETITKAAQEKDKQ
jgi:hypothetical protein